MDQTAKSFRVLLVGLLGVLAACGGDDTGATTSVDVVPVTTTTILATTTVTEAPTTTTLATTTTTAPQATTSTIPPSTTTNSVPDLYPPDPFTESADGAAGSGCAPGSQVLPDGQWFGFLSEVNGKEVTFDLACFYFGDVAWEKAAEQGEEAYNDYWIVNENPGLRSVEVEGGATVWWISPEVSELQPLVFGDSWPVVPAEAAYTACPGEWCTVWLIVEGGIVTEIVEQYLP